MTMKKKRQKPKGAGEVQSPHAIFPKPIPRHRHGLFLALQRHKIDGRTRLARVLRETVALLLEGHKEPVPGPVQLLAQRCAFKLIRASLYEMAVLTGKESSADSYYLGLANSIRADLQALHQMRELPSERIPTLGEYLREIRKGEIKLVAVESEE